VIAVAAISVPFDAPGSDQRTLKTRPNVNLVGA
jgi:hypothetical protein